MKVKNDLLSRDSGVDALFCVLAARGKYLEFVCKVHVQTLRLACCIVQSFTYVLMDRGLCVLQCAQRLWSCRMEPAHALILPH